MCGWKERIVAVLNQQKLKHLQECELIIAKEIKRICDNYGIKYFMVGGTLLGAIRHQGFILWDDDIDFGMERSEYEKFCKICKTDLKEEFVLQTWNTDENYPFSFGKIRLRGTSVQESFAPRDEENNGIFVDIFPYDNVPDDEKARRRHAYAYFLYKRMLWTKKGYGKNIKKEGFIKCIKYKVFNWAVSILSYNKIKDKFSKVLNQYNDNNTKKLVFDGIYSYEKNSIERLWMSSVREYQFEDTMFMSFEDYDGYLRHMFNNYMQLPPEKDRHNHDILDVDFGKY